MLTYPFLVGFGFTLLVSVIFVGTFWFFLQRNERNQGNEATRTMTPTTEGTGAATPTPQTAPTSLPSSTPYPSPSPAPRGATAYPAPRGATAYPVPGAATAYPPPRGTIAYPPPRGTIAYPPPPTMTLTPSPQDSPSARTLSSQGIGANRTEWETTYGSPEGETSGHISYSAGAFLVAYQGDTIRYLERVWGQKDALPLQEARQIASRFFPPDSTLLQTSSESETLVVDRYHSEWLIKRYPDTMDWGQGKPGDFMVQYTVDSDHALSFVITTDTQPDEQQ